MPLIVWMMTSVSTRTRSDRVGHRLAGQLIGRDFEVLREQRWKGGQIGHSAIGVVENDEVPVPRSRLDLVRDADLRQHHQGAHRRGGDSAAHVTDDGGLPVLDAQYARGVDAGIDAPDDHHVARRVDRQGRVEAVLRERLVAGRQIIDVGHVIS